MSPPALKLPSDSPPIVDMRDLAVGYSRRVVLSDINWSLPVGSFTALVGANGSGKSTLLKTIAGILSPISGDIHLQIPIDTAPAIGYVPQSESLDPLFLFSNFDVVLMGCYGRVLPGRFVHQQEKQFARECLSAVGMSDVSHQNFSELSGGQKQRVLIARALMARPDLLLLDEPTSGIDPAAAQSIMELLTRIHQTHQVTILMVTHDLAAVRRYHPTLVWLDGGRLQFGPAEQWLSHAGPWN